MKKRSLLLVALCLFVCFAALAKPARILVFSKTKGFRHQSIAAGKLMFLGMQDSLKISVDTTEDASFFTTRNLKKYKVVVFLNTTGDVLDSLQQVAFADYIHHGGTFLGLHAASDTEYGWPWYNKLVGGYFVSHPKPQKATYTVLDKKHPATAFMPESFVRFEELYNFKDLQKDMVTFALQVDEKTYEGGKMGDFHPMAWYHDFEGGKAYYTALGHHPETYSDAQFQQHIAGALRWLLGRN